MFVYIPIGLLVFIMYNFATKREDQYYESDKSKSLKFTVVSSLILEIDEISYFLY